MMDIFENVKKKFGFGCMRLPMKGSEVDKEEFSEMVDTFLDNFVSDISGATAVRSSIRL